MQLQRDTTPDRYHRCCNSSATIPVATTRATPNIVVAIHAIPPSVVSLQLPVLFVVATLTTMLQLCACCASVVNHPTTSFGPIRQSKNGFSRKKTS